MSDLLTPAFVLVGFLWGLASDRIAARWPEHEEGVATRPIDWRTAVVAMIGSAALGALPDRFGETSALALFTAYGLALTLLLATDLDQRLLPDLITLPLIPIVLVVALAGFDPLVAGRLEFAFVAAIALPLALWVLSLPFGQGAIGMGDLKLLVSVGLLTGLERSVAGVITGALLSGVVVALLLATRRVSLRSYIPFGPFLIVGAFWAMLMPR